MKILLSVLAIGFGLLAFAANDASAGCVRRFAGWHNDHTGIRYMWIEETCYGWTHQFINFNIAY